jgi:hypothetical protein
MAGRTARKEVSKVKELQSSGLIGPRRNQTSRDRHSYQNTSQHAHSNSSNNQHVPMDIDATNITTPFKKLTDEGASTVPSRGTDALGVEPKATWLATARRMPMHRTFRINETCNMLEKLQPAPLLPPVTLPTSSSTPSVPPPPPPKLSYAQQIRVLEAKMSDEERSLYLDARNMGEDFCSAGL